MDAWKDMYGMDPAALERRLISHVGLDTWPPVHDALAMASEKHARQKREGSGEPYVAHAIRSALILREVAEQQSPALLCAALLHDVVEITETSLDEIENRLGSQVGDLVRALTYPPLREGETCFQRSRRYFEHLRWEGRDAQIAKSADRLDNVLTMRGAFTPEHAREYLRESREAVLPLTLACNTALYHALQRAVEEEERRMGVTG
jgi:guanosine-3',5'-bis(diphosphate) 3'-pyrophosphohydrolase